jgi:hypothetical protein
MTNLINHDQATVMADSLKNLLDLADEAYGAVSKSKQLAT